MLYAGRPAYVPVGRACAFEVELAGIRPIADCAAFGIPSEQLESEQEIMLDVILKPGQTLRAIELAPFINDNKAPPWSIS
tara:strand:- start:12291 stop:12530 length:240 start_codon:yes stop_codon:yes gene_type:complete